VSKLGVYIVEAMGDFDEPFGLGNPELFL